ncbi:hypothetical protein FP568_13435 [Pandoraea pnomenusa]|uniref:hypothetical protein n=1 Tax=Pandoraea pnomenusa TaxID=93220 RepID=UPI00119860AE|nr:hypothetical protein [Pandoraea pnomenusa]QDX22160.1 hypothetical protein FP568_13435 [Pandoraea pnomenusa]
MSENKNVTLADAIIKQIADPMYKMWPIPEAVRDAIKRVLANTPAAQIAGQEAVLYFVHDNEYGYNEFKTDAERHAAHKSAIAGYLDDGWSEEVDSVVSGIVTHKTVKCNEEQAPSRCETHPEQDGDDCDACTAWNEWPNHDFDFTCSYEPEALAAAPVNGGERDDARRMRTLCRLLDAADDLGNGFPGEVHHAFQEGAKVVRDTLDRFALPEDDEQLHASDCAVHNMPAYPNGTCNCERAADAPQAGGEYDGDSEQSRAAFRDYDARVYTPSRSAWQIWRDACAWQASLSSPAKVGGQRIDGLGRMTADDDGIVRLQFASEEAAQAFMCDFAPSVELDAMPDIPAKVGGDEREAFEKAVVARYRHASLVRCQDGYAHDATHPTLRTYASIQMLWEIWQDRAALSADGGECHKESQAGPLLCKAAGELPEGWQIVVEVENGYGGVNLIAPDGMETDFSGRDMLLSEQISAAIDAAIAAKAKGDEQ